MKLLVDKTLLSYATPVVFSGFSASQHNTNMMSTFDSFDSYEPDIYIADADLLNNTVYKAIEERPALRVCVFQNGNNEHPKQKEFKERFGNLYEWINTAGCADIYTYRNPSYVKEYAADLVAIENNLGDFLSNLSVPNEIIFRIFTTDVVHSKYYCGMVPDHLSKYIYKSSKFSIAAGNNFYNSAICGCYPITPENFNIDILYQDKNEEIKDLKENTLASNTNFHFMAKVLDKMGYDKQSKIILEKMKELL